MINREEYLDDYGLQVDPLFDIVDKKDQQLDQANTTIKDAEMREKGLRAGIQNIADSLGVGDEPRFKWIDIEISDMKTTIDKLCEKLLNAADKITEYTSEYNYIDADNARDYFIAIVKEVRAAIAMEEGKNG